MAFEQTVFVSDPTTENIRLPSPCVLTLDPSRLITDGTYRFFKIVYDWGDGNTNVVNYKPILGINSTLPFSNDIGDPRNYPQTKVFSLNNTETKNFNITVRAYSQQDLPFTYNITLSLSAAPIDQNIHLTKTKMFGLDNKILYTFETETPKNILMSLVNWKSKPIETSVSALNRDYKILPPFLRKINNNPNIS